MPGRKRKHDPTIPAHIDQARLPPGIYWDRTGKGRWILVDTTADGARQTRRVAGPDARLSELQAIVEDLHSTTGRGTVGRVMERFHNSSAFAKLEPRTQADYRGYRRTIEALRTRSGGTFDQLLVDRLTPPVLQRLVENFAAAGTPTKGNRLFRYLHRVFRWGVNHGECRTNPGAGVVQATEANKVRVPELAAYMRVLEFAQARGRLPTTAAGSLPPYLWICMELAYLCRLRGIEVITLTDQHITAEGIRTNRRKGSGDGVMSWHPRLRAAVDAALELRQLATDRHRRPVPLRPEDRTLIVKHDGAPLTKSGLDTAWQRMMRQAVAAGVLASDERFGLHAMKHRGISDTTGHLGDKQQAAGHRSPQMTQRYDHSVPTIGAPFSGEFSGDGDSGHKKST